MSELLSPKQLLESEIRAAIDEHDRCRVAVQEKLTTIWGMAEKEINKADEGLHKYVEEEFKREDTERQVLIQAINEKFYGESTSEEERKAALKMGKDELMHKEVSFRIVRKPQEGSLRSCIRIREFTRSDKVYDEEFFEGDDDTVMEKILQALGEKVNTHFENKLAEGESVDDEIRKIRDELEELKAKINDKLEREFTKEDDRLQALLMTVVNEDDDDKDVMAKLRSGLIVEKSYTVLGKKETMWVKIGNMCHLHVQKAIRNFGEIKAGRVHIDKVDAGRVYFTLEGMFSSVEEKELEKRGVSPHKKILMKIQLVRACEKDKYNDWDESKEGDIDWNGSIVESFPKVIRVLVNSGRTSFFDTKLLEPEATYAVRSQGEYQDQRSKWSDWAEFTAPKLPECIGWWTPQGDQTEILYLTDNSNPRVAKCVCDRETTIIGCPVLPFGRCICWDAVLKSIYLDREHHAFVGVAPHDIDQGDTRNMEKCGWYFDFYSFALIGGPPHNYLIPGVPCTDERNPEIRVRPGNVVNVRMDTTEGKLIFGLNGSMFKTIFKGIPLDKPLVPCVIVSSKDDTVELSNVAVFGKKSFHKSVIRRSNKTTSEPIKEGENEDLKGGCTIS